MLNIFFLCALLYLSLFSCIKVYFPLLWTALSSSLSLFLFCFFVVHLYTTRTSLHYIILSCCFCTSCMYVHVLQTRGFLVEFYVYLFGRQYSLLYDMFFTRVRSHGVCTGCSVASGYLLNNKLNEILSSRIPFLIITAPPLSVEQNETLTVQSPVADAHCLFGHFQLSHGFV